MSSRWQYKVVEVSPKLFGGSAEVLETELNRLGLQGWELVNAVQATAMDKYRLFLKKAGA